MAKYVTRTMVQYKYSFGRVAKGEDGTYVMEKVTSIISETKLGERNLKKLMKENGISDYSVIGYELVSEKWAVPLDVFMANAVKVEE